MISYQQLKSLLSQRLTGSLPGEDAQRKMSAIPKNKLRFDLSARESARESGVLILFFPKEGEWWFPMILRHDYGGVHSAQVSLPGGRREPVDKNIIQTAIREAEEEIGISGTSIEYLGQLTELFIPVSNHLVYPSVAVMDHEPIFVKEEREVRRIVTSPVKHLLDSTRQKEKIIDVKGYQIHAPYFDLDQEVVWGATAMILSELKTILEEIGGLH